MNEQVTPDNRGDAQSELATLGIWLPIVIVVVGLVLLIFVAAQTSLCGTAQFYGFTVECIAGMLGGGGAVLGTKSTCVKSMVVAALLLFFLGRAAQLGILLG